MSGTALAALLVLTALGAAGVLACRAPNARRALMLAADLAFAGLIFRNSPAHLALLLAVLAVNYGWLRAISAAAPGRRAAAAGALVALDALLLALSRYEPLQQALSSAWPALPVQKPGFFVMVGGGFLFLRLAHLAFEAASGELRLAWLDYLNFILFFPAYLYGPLDRYERFAADLEASRPLTWERAYLGACRLLWGLFKLVVLSVPFEAFSIARLGRDTVLALPAWKTAAALGSFWVWLYLSFSGYADAAIGAGAFFGLVLPENFRAPFLARNIQDFWHRWHITLFDWLLDYAYYPLAWTLTRAGGLGASTAAALAAAATFLLAGVWHGAGWALLLYGAYHGAGFLLFLAYRQALERLVPAPALARYQESRLVRVAATALTLAFVGASYFFYADRLSLLAALLRRAA